MLVSIRTETGGLLVAPGPMTIIADEVQTKCKRCGGVVVKDILDDSICLMCGARYYFDPIFEGIIFSNFHVIHHRKPGVPRKVYEKELRYRRRANGKCPECGGEPYLNRLSCFKCLEKYQRHNLKRKEQKEKLKRTE